jgi:hypothetical protein
VRPGFKPVFGIQQEDGMGRRKNGGATDEGAKIGHNSNLNQDEKVKLSGFISEIERLDQQARDISSERGTLYKSAKEPDSTTRRSSA